MAPRTGLFRVLAVTVLLALVQGQQELEVTTKAFNAIEIQGSNKAFFKIGPTRDGITNAIADEVSPGVKLTFTPDSPNDFAAYDDHIVDQKHEEDLFIPALYRNDTKKEEATTTTRAPPPPPPTTRRVTFGRQPEPPPSPQRPVQPQVVRTIPAVQQPAPITRPPPPPPTRPPPPPPTRPPPPPPPATRPPPPPVTRPPPPPPTRPPPRPLPTQAPFRPPPPPQPRLQPHPLPPVQQQFVPHLIPATQAPFRPPPPQPRAPFAQQTFRPAPVTRAPQFNTRPPAPAQPFRPPPQTQRPFRPLPTVQPPVRPFRPPQTTAPPRPLAPFRPQPRRPQPSVGRPNDPTGLRNGFCPFTIFYQSGAASTFDSQQAYTHFATVVSVDQCARTCHEFNCANAYFDPVNRHCQFNPGGHNQASCPAYPSPFLRNNVPLSAVPLRISCVTCQRRRRTNRVRTRFFTNRLGQSRRQFAPQVIGHSVANVLHGVILRQPQSVAIGFGPSVPRDDSFHSSHSDSSELPEAKASPSAEAEAESDSAHQSSSGSELIKLNMHPLSSAEASNESKEVLESIAATDAPRGFVDDATDNEDDSERPSTRILHRASGSLSSRKIVAAEKPIESTEDFSAGSFFQ